MTITLGFTQSIVEDATIAWLEGLGYPLLHGLAIATGDICLPRDENSLGTGLEF
jgi:hypothetical protein